MKTSVVIHPDELSCQWINSAIENSIDVIALHPVGGKSADISLHNLINKFDDSTFINLINSALEKGIEIEYEMHTTRYLLPTEKFKEHPEYFRMNKDGKRTTDINFCFTNTAALDIIAENAVLLAQKLYKNTNYYYFWMDDIEDGYCNCKSCKQYSPSDQQLIVMNRIIKELKKYNPNAKLAYLAYLDFIKCPTKVKPEKGIFLEYAPIARNTSVSISDPTDVKNVAETKDLTKLLQYFGTKDAKVLEYWLDNSLFSNWKMPPKKLDINKDVIKADVEFYKTKGFNNISTFACYLGKEYSDLYGNFDLSSWVDCLKELL